MTIHLDDLNDAVLNVPAADSMDLVAASMPRGEESHKFFRTINILIISKYSYTNIDCRYFFKQVHA